MLHRLHLSILLLAAIAVGCSSNADKQQAPASTTSFDRTMHEADSLYNSMHFREAYDLYRQLLDHPEAQNDNEKRMNALNSLCMTSELADHKSEQTTWMKQLLDLAQKTGDDYYHSQGLLAMGKRVYEEGDKQRGIDYVKKSIDLIDKSKRQDADHLAHSQMIILAGLYNEMQDYDNALRINEQNVTLTHRGTRWGTNAVQQQIDQRMALAKLALILVRMGNVGRADSAYAAWKAVKYEGNHSRDYFIVDYLRMRGLYHEAVPIYKDLIKRVQAHGDTLGEMMSSAKWGLADVYHHLGYDKQATALLQQVIIINDTLKNRQAHRNAQELVAVYHVQEQEEQLLRQQTTNTRQYAVLAITLLLLFAIIIYAIIVVRQKHVLSLKNQSLAAQIAESLTYKDLYNKEKHENTPPACNEDIEFSTLNDEQLFLYIDDLIVRERLFLDPKFDRQTIMKRLQLSKDQVGTAFSKGSQFSKLTDYIQELRLDYSTLLMTTQNQLSISQVAADSGFSSYSYYCKCFHQRFGMTPSEFRNSLRISNPVEDSM